ncbi:MAG: folylpolyglutamate synthase/dihydrofolate synthase family protein [Candidatus Omnitrophota bacterium]
MSFDSEAYLNSFTNWEPRLDQAGVSSFSIDRMIPLLRIFRHPESKLRFAHIAGSKGKGSTAAFLASIVRAAGYRVGLYTSPHLYSVRERIRVLAPDVQPAGPFEGMIPQEDLDELLRSHQGEIDALRGSGTDITYYELLTALAVVYFARQKVRLVVLETGLGGRLDATNYFETSVCGITPIGLEHTVILGGTLELIAAEKAAIIKEDSQSVVVAPQAPGAMGVIEARCREFGISPSVIGRDIAVTVKSQDIDGAVFSVEGRRSYRDLSTSLIGRHQAANAAMAIAMAEDLEVFSLALSEEAVARGVKEACWPARFEIVSRDPFVVVDCAHTVESAAALAQTVAEVFPGRRVTLVFGSSTDKDTAGMARALAPVVERVIFTKSPHSRASDPQQLAGAGLFPGLPAMVSANVAEALQEARSQAGRDGLVLVCGSVFVAAEATRVFRS